MKITLTIETDADTYTINNIISDVELMNYRPGWRPLVHDRVMDMTRMILRSPGGDGVKLIKHERKSSE